MNEEAMTRVGSQRHTKKKLQVSLSTPWGLMREWKYTSKHSQPRHCMVI